MNTEDKDRRVTSELDDSVPLPDPSLLSSQEIRQAIKPASRMTREENQREVIIVIQGVLERVLLTEGRPIILGRTDLSARFFPEIDLTPFNAAERGVSRSHASLHTQGRRVILTDLGSTNGTFVRGKRLAPNQGTVVRHSSEVVLGRLPIQILFD